MINMHTLKTLMEVVEWGKKIYEIGHHVHSHFSKSKSVSVHHSKEQSEAYKLQSQKMERELWMKRARLTDDEWKQYKDLLIKKGENSLDDEGSPLSDEERQTGIRLRNKYEGINSNLTETK